MELDMLSAVKKPSRRFQAHREVTFHVFDIHEPFGGFRVTTQTRDGHHARCPLLWMKQTSEAQWQTALTQSAHSN